MTPEDTLPENIQALLDRADLSLLRGKHGEASTFFWKATEAATKQAASARGHRLRSLDYDDVEPFIDGLEQKPATIGVGLPRHPGKPGQRRRGPVGP